MKNILLAVPRMNIGGAETYVKELALGLKQRGYNVYVASGGGVLANELMKQGIRHFFVPMRLHPVIAAWLLGRIVKKYKIDILHANSAAAGIAAVRLKDKYPVKIVYTAHGVFGHNAKERTIQKADQIICVSEFVKNYAREKGYAAEKLTTIYTGIDTNKFCPQKEAGRRLRQLYHLTEATFTLAITARIKNLQNKGHLDILEVLTRYNKAAGWHLFVIGKGRALGRLKAEIKHRGLEDRVHCLGHSSAVQNILAVADVVVLPSKLETFGLVLAEAMAMEKPAVAYAVGGTPEVIADGKTGFLARLGDINDLYEKLSLLADNPLCCQEMGQAARLWVRGRFSQEKMLDEVEALYDRI